MKVPEEYKLNYCFTIPETVSTWQEAKKWMCEKKNLTNAVRNAFEDFISKLPLNLALANAKGEPLEITGESLITVKLPNNWKGA